MNAAARTLWQTNNFGAFAQGVQFAVERNLTQAWLQGAAKCGISEGDLTQEEFNALTTMILASLSRISGLGAFILQQRDAGKGFTSLGNRLGMWANRWIEAFSQAQTMACGDVKMMWVLGDADHCSTCKKLDGKVKRASVWEAADVYPRATNGTLECNGFNCACILEQTAEPGTPGPLPNLP